jgi:hypothetical protein
MENKGPSLFSSLILDMEPVDENLRVLLICLVLCQFWWESYVSVTDIAH